MAASTLNMPNRLAYIASAGVAAAAALLVLLRSSSKGAPSRIQSPLYTILPKLSPKDISRLPYPPDALPGSRDVETPYGTIKVFEWGPEDGRKVLFVHGISTPCIALGAAADKLVKRGCRVMLFDLFGRGWSDAPTGVKHDARLYTTQILLVLASSPLCWTGTAAFDLVGYSFGGGISTCFTRHFPDLVRSLILLAPGGIIRTHHISWQSRILYSSGILPERFLAFLVLRRLRPSEPTPVVPQPPASSSTATSDDSYTAKSSISQAGNAEAAVSAEVGRTTSRDPDADDDPDQTLPHRPNVNPDRAVAWQIEHHDGFIGAFMSSIRAGPIHEQHADWAAVGRTLAARRADGASGPHSDKVLLVLGARDPIVLKEELAGDAMAVFGAENVEVALVDAAHDFPIAESGALVDVICGFWGDR